MKKLLILGAKGMLGQEFMNVSEKYPEYEFIGVDKEEMDITLKDSIDSTIKRIKPDIVINCAAFTDVNACEERNGFETAMEVNANGVKNLSDVCKEELIDLVHISTDYVFNSNSPDGYGEDYNKLDPMNAYGKSKMKGERFLAETAGGVIGSDFNLNEPKFYIVRTSWLFGSGATNFIAKILQFAEQNEYLTVVEDEIGCPTYTKDLVENIMLLLKHNYKPGIYHVAGKGECSRYEFAKRILECKGIEKEVKKARLQDFKRKAHIANYSILLNTKLPPIRRWEVMVEDYLSSN